jgi:inorganic phosphate transporter, PiT family
VSTGASGVVPVADVRKLVTEYIQTKTLTDSTIPALRQLSSDITQSIAAYKSLASVPQDQVPNVRNDMYLTDEAIRLLIKDGKPALAPADQDSLKQYRAALDVATKFIPNWVKVAVAIALGLGTMIGWKRIVITVGEKIGKDHLTYGQGASAELVAMLTIGAADMYGLPVSTTHVLSSGVAGTMAANGSGLQMATVRNLLLAWVLTLPASIILSGLLFWLFRSIF